MKPRGLLLIVAIATVTLAPTFALAGGRSRVVVAGPRGGVVVVQPPVRFARPVPKVVVATPSVFPQPIDPWKFWGARGVHKPFVGRHFFGSAAVPFAVAAPTYYASAPVTYVVPAPSVVPAPPPSMPTVVEYENGFYELRGDGMTVPYRWVWIPKPPPPPPAPPAMAPPSEAPASPPARYAEQPPRQPSAVYRWTDEQGVTTYTDRLERVPERYRADAKAGAL
jgi:hypothetical protein